LTTCSSRRCARHERRDRTLTIVLAGATVALLATDAYRAYDAELRN
jgi:hypothetical protein